jgi:hypothetical protein
VSEEWVGEASVFGFGICHGRWRGSHSKNLTGALQIDGAECTLPVGREAYKEIPGKAEFAVAEGPEMAPRESIRGT